MSREQKLTLGLLFKPPVPGHGYIGLEEGIVVVQLLSHGQVLLSPQLILTCHHSPPLRCLSGQCLREAEDSLPVPFGCQQIRGGVPWTRKTL